MNKEWMLMSLIKLGFTETDAQVYVFLAAEGPQKARDITKALKLHRQRLYRSLQKLQNKGIVNASPDYPVCFSAVLFEKALDVLIEKRIEQQHVLQESKESLLSTWRSITKKNDWKS